MNQNLLNEARASINQFYLREQNRIILDSHCRDPSFNFLQENQLWFMDDKPGPQIPSKGMVSIPKHAIEIVSPRGDYSYPASYAFQEKFRLLCLSSIYSSPEVLEILR